jgi:hypothetical protein
MGDQPVTRPLLIHRTTQTQNKRTQISMPRVGFEPTIPVFERVKIIHVLDRAATVINALTNSSVEYNTVSTRAIARWKQLNG